MSSGTITAMASTSGFNSYAAGKKVYGAGRNMPTSGKLSNTAGYTERDAKAKARKEALIRRAQGGLS